MEKTLSQKIKVGSYTISISNQDKVLFPDDGITKADLINYYYSIAPLMLLYVKNRPITMHRYPMGINHEGFYQKNAEDYFPSWVKRIPIKTEEHKTVNYVVIDKVATFVYLANLGCITPHIWLSTLRALDNPDRLIFDLDPSGKNFDFSLIKKTALSFKKLLEDLDLVPFVMTTGSRGLHVVVPLKGTMSYDVVRPFARSLAQQLVQQDPEHLTVDVSKKKRGKKIFIDYLRNSFSATGVAPYAVRARNHAPIATPLAWDELSDLRSSDMYTMKTIFKRLEKHGDPWHDIDKHARTLTYALKMMKS